MKQVGRDLGHWHSTCERKSRRSLGQSSGSTRKHMRVTCRRWSSQFWTVPASGPRRSPLQVCGQLVVRAGHGRLCTPSVQQNDETCSARLYYIYLLYIRYILCVPPVCLNVFFFFFFFFFLLLLLLLLLLFDILFLYLYHHLQSHITRHFSPRSYFILFSIFYFLFLYFFPSPMIPFLYSHNNMYMLLSHDRVYIFISHIAVPPVYLWSLNLISSSNLTRCRLLLCCTNCHVYILPIYSIYCDRNLAVPLWECTRSSHICMKIEDYTDREREREIWFHGSLVIFSHFSLSFSFDTFTVSRLRKHYTSWNRKQNVIMRKFFWKMFDIARLCTYMRIFCPSYYENIYCNLSEYCETLYTYGLLQKEFCMKNICLA